VVLPLIAKVSGVESHRCLEYASHPKRLSPQGLLDRTDLETRFGQFEPGRLLEELAGGLEGLEDRMRVLSNEDLRCEVLALLDWREKANARLESLEKRVAWAFLGILPDSCGQADIKKAFKRRALELHPDKGGDAERFQLLQDMKYLLIHKTVKQQSNEERTHDDGQSCQKESAEAADEDDETGFSSDSSYDASEELKKMFPNKSRRKQRKEDQHEDGDDLLVQQGSTHFNRAQHEGMRRKLHRHLVDVWRQAGKLTDEIRRAQSDGGVQALQNLRRFVDRFCETEIAHAEDKRMQKTADRIFRSFVEQGAEILCAAGAVDPIATISCIAMQVKHPLLTMAPSPDFEQRCNALLEAIRCLPMTVQEHTEQIQAFLLHSGSSPTTMSKGAAGNSQGSFQVTFLLPQATPLHETLPRKSELPGVNELETVLPAGATISDLRAAAQRVCEEAGFGNVPPRLFCGGRFIIGCGDTPVAQLESLRAGCAVECLPSNRGLCLNNSEQMLEQGSRSTSTRKDRDSSSIVTQLCQQSTPVVNDANPAQQVGSKSGTETTTGGRWSPKVLLGREEMNSKATCSQQDDGEDEDSDEWFDDFFGSQTTKRNVDTKEACQQQPQQQPQHQEEQQPSQKQPAQRGKDAMDARMRAQRKAAEARKRYDEEKQAANVEKTVKQGHERLKTAQASEAEAKQPNSSKTARMSSLETSAVVVAGADKFEKAIQKRRTKWDSNWSHMCAGDRRADGSAIYCHPCNEWVITGDPFDHHSFELHCEKIGHYGWID